MPYSSTSGKAWILEYLKDYRPRSVVDIGAGAGTYSSMFRSAWPGAHWCAIEIWPTWIEKFALHDLYDVVLNVDARDWEPDDRYDIAFLGDVLEHMTKKEARALLKKVRAACNTVIVSIPLGPYPQGEFEGNPHEAHITDNWTDKKFIKTFGEPLAQHIDNEIGVFVYQRKRPVKIAVYAISKNEEQFVERFCASAADADLIVIGDTGSSDGTPRVARECGAVVHDIVVTPWRFDRARDAVLALLPRNIDICISLDLDEVLTEGWRQEIERVWTPDLTTRLDYKFDWGHGILFNYQKIHARHGYHWHHPVHEYPRVDGRVKEVFAYTDKTLVVHLPDDTKSRGQYMPLLELAIKEDRHCPRNRFYHARELSFYGRWEEAIAALKAYLGMPEADWGTERCYAMRLLGKCYMELLKWDEALMWYRRACAEWGDSREPWVELAICCNHMKRWQECYGAAMVALTIQHKALVYTMDPSVWWGKPHDMAAISSYWLGNLEDAVKHGRDAVAAQPDAPSEAGETARLVANLKFYEATLAAKNAPPDKPKPKKTKPRAKKATA